MRGVVPAPQREEKKRARDVGAKHPEHLMRAVLSIQTGR